MRRVLWLPLLLLSAPLFAQSSLTFFVTSQPNGVIVEDVLTLAIGAGASWNFTPRPGLVFDARYLPLTLNTSANGEELDLDMDPLFLSGGVRIRF